MTKGGHFFFAKNMEFGITIKRKERVGWFRLGLILNFKIESPTILKSINQHLI